MKTTPSTLLLFTRCTLFLLPLMAARAELISADDPRFGQNSITLDTATGLGWLDLTCTTNLSYIQAEALRAPGQPLAGFRHATANEILTLCLDAGIPHSGFFDKSDPAASAIDSLINLLGPTEFLTGVTGIGGITGTLTTDFHPYGLEVDSLFGGGNIYTVNVATRQTTYDPDTAFPSVGNWMVKAIPEPNLPAALVALTLLTMRSHRQSFPAWAPVRNSRALCHP